MIYYNRVIQQLNDGKIDVSEELKTCIKELIDEVSNSKLQSYCTTKEVVSIISNIVNKVKELEDGE